MIQIEMLYLTVTALLRERVGVLRKDTERGAGGNTLEILLLAIGGVIVAGVVVLAVKAAVDSKTAKLTTP